MIRLARLVLLGILIIWASKLHTPFEGPSMSTKPNPFESALAAEGVTGQLADLARSIYQQESGGGRNTQTSNRGAVGGMQILAGTFKEVADKDWSIDDPVQNARAGIRYLKKLDKQSGGVPELTAAGYYGGPGGLEKARRGVAVSDPRNPNAPDTLRYGREVVARMGGAPSGGGQVPGAALAATALVTPPVVVAENQVPSEPGPVPFPAEVMAALTRKAPAMVEPGQDPWGAFLRGMPQARKPVQVADLSYGGQVPQADVPRYQAAPMENRRPNFEAFSAWKGRAA